MKRTSRGLAIYAEFVDTYGHTVRVQKSSSAGVRRCWLFCEDDGKDCIFHLGNWQALSPHLSPAQARRMAKALLRFADGDRK